MMVGWGAMLWSASGLASWPPSESASGSGGDQRLADDMMSCEASTYCDKVSNKAEALSRNASHGVETASRVPNNIAFFKATLDDSNSRLIEGAFELMLLMILFNPSMSMLSALALALKACKVTQSLAGQKPVVDAVLNSWHTIHQCEGRITHVTQGCAKHMQDANSAQQHSATTPSLAPKLHVPEQPNAITQNNIMPAGFG
jgi:hypothetical protein